MVANLRRARVAALATATLAACADSPSMLDTHGSNARHIAGLWWLMLGLAAVVVLTVTVFVVIATGRKGDDTTPPDDGAQG